MANEYNELEQLVNDVTNIDTARMTLRWALERLNSIEKERAELKRTLAVAEDARKTLEVKAHSLEQSFKSRGKVLEEKEGFYTKLEATMALLGDGKLDIQQLLKKEARLDQARLELEREYQDKFEELDRNQNSVIARWNQRLLDVEAQYAKRLSESQNRYDSLRQELEADYQGRLGALQSSYMRKEKELTERIASLESSVKAGGNALEGRRKEIESEFLAKKSEIEGNYLKLKSMLEAGFQERIHSMENEHCAQVRSLEKTWNAERERLMAEQRARDDQFEKSQKEMARLEAQLSAQQEQHHRGIIDIISGKEESFRGKVAELEREKAAYEKAAEELAARLESKEKDWALQKGQLQADFARRCAEIESAAMERALALEKDGSARKAAMEKLIAAAKEEFAREASARVEDVRRDMEGEKARLEEDNQIKTAALDRAALMIRSLEETLASSGEEHQRELLAKIRTNEENFRVKLSEFEAEKDEYKAEIARLTEAAGSRDARFIEETKRMQKEFDDKYAELEAKAAAAAGRDRASYEERIAALTVSFEKREKNWVLERERLGCELATVSNSVQALASERVEKIKSAYEARKAELEKQFEEKLAAATSALSFEKAQMIADLKTASEQYTRLSEQFKELENTIAVDRRAHHEEIMGKLAEKEAALKEQAERFGKELALKDEFAAGAALDVSAKEAAWLEEKRRLSADFASRLSLQEAGLAKREEALENQYRLKSAELEKNAAEVRELMEADFNRRVEVEKQAFEAAKARLSDENRLKGEQLAEARAMASERVEKIRALYETRKAELEKQLEERMSAAAAAMASEKARLLADLRTAGEEYARLSERSKELENAIASDRRLHHEELMRHMAAKESALNQQAGDFEKEISKLREDMEVREAAWLEEREKMRSAVAEAAARYEREAAERVSRIEAEHEKKRAELERILNERLAEKEAILRLETGKMLEASRLKDGRLGEAHERIKELEGRLSVLGETHRRELAERLSEKESELKAQADALRGEKEAALERQASVLRGEMSREQASFSAREAALAEDKERLNRSLIEASSRAEREIKERTAVIAAEFAGKKEELERMLEERMAAASSALAFEKAGLIADLKTASEEYTRLSEHSKELESALARDRQEHHQELMARLADKEAALKAQADDFNDEMRKLRETMSVREEEWLAERETLLKAAAEAGDRAEREAAERAEVAARGYERKKAELERILSERLAAKESVFRLETSKILEEGKIKDERLASAHAQVRDLEHKLNALSDAHHQELAARLADKEAALKAQAGSFAGEMKAMADAAAAREASWTDEKAALASGFAARLLEAEKEMAARESLLREQYRVKEAEIARAAAESRETAEAEFSRRLAEEKGRIEAERARLHEENAIKDGQLESMHRKVKDLETAIGGLKDAHHAELMKAQEDKEAALRAQSGGFNSELAALRETHNSKISFLSRERDAALKAQAANYEKDLNSLRESLAAKEAAWSREKEKSAAAMAETSARAERELKAHAAQLSAEYDRKKAELERILNERLAEKEAVLKLENEKVLEASRLKDGQLSAAYARAKDLEERLNGLTETHHGELMARMAEKEAALKAQAETLNGERLSALDAQARSFREELSALGKAFGAKEAAWQAEREKAASEVDGVRAAAERELRSRMERLAAEYEGRRAELEKQFNEKYASASEALAFEKSRLMADLRTAGEEYARLAERSRELELTIEADRQAHHKALMEKLAEKEAALKEQADGFGREIGSLRDSLAAEYESRKAALEKQFEDKFASASQALAFEKSRLIEDLRTASEEYTRLAGQLKDMEAAAAADRQAHHKALLAGMADKEAALKEQAADFERETAELREGLEREKSRLAEEVRVREERLAAAYEKVSELERGMAAVRESYQRDMADRLREKEASFAARLSAVEADNAARREALASGFAAKEKALSSEAEGRSAAERSAWQAQQARLEAMLSRTAEDFRKAQKEIDELSAAVSRKEDEKRQLKAELDETARRAAEDLRNAGSRALAEKAEELESAYRERRERLEAETSALREELRGEERRRAGEISANFEAASRRMAQENEALRNASAKMREEMAAAQSKADSYMNELMDKDHAHQAEMLGLKETLAAELEAKLAAAADRAVQMQQERVRFLEKELARARQDGADAMRNFEESFRKEKEMLAAELGRRQDYITVMDQKLREMETELAKSRQNAAAEYLVQITDQDEKFKALAAEYEARHEKLEAEAAARVEEVRAEGEERLKELERRMEAGEEKTLKERAARAAELSAAVSEAAERAAAPLMERIKGLEQEMLAVERRAEEEAKARETAFRREKERLAGELSRRDGYMETADFKLREMEAELIKVRQNAAAACLGQISEQDDKFREMTREYEDRQAKLEKDAAERIEAVKRDYEDRLRDLEETLKAKESLVRQGGDFWRQKQAELDAQHSALNLKVNAFNEEMFAQRRTLSERENALNAQQLEREKDLAARMSEIQKLKVELTKTIAEYKSRK